MVLGFTSSSTGSTRGQGCGWLARDRLRREVFAAGDFVQPGLAFGLPDPASVDDLTEQGLYWEFMGECGTDSIIEVAGVVLAGATAQEYRPAN